MYRAVQHGGAAACDGGLLRVLVPVTVLFLVRVTVLGMVRVIVLGMVLVLAAAAAAA
jgi:hypothetical protein